MRSFFSKNKIWSSEHTIKVFSFCSRTKNIWFLKKKSHFYNIQIFLSLKCAIMNLIGNLPRLPQQQYLTLQFQELCQSLLITTKISVCCLIWKEARGNIELDGVRRRLQKRKKKKVSFLTSIVYNSG